MNHDRLMKKGLLRDKQDTLKELEIKADRLIKDVNYYLFPAVTEGIKGVKIDHARQAMSELVKTYDSAMALIREIKRLEEELGKEV